MQHVQNTCIHSKIVNLNLLSFDINSPLEMHIFLQKWYRNMLIYKVRISCDLKNIKFQIFRTGHHKPLFVTLKVSHLLSTSSLYFLKKKTKTVMLCLHVPKILGFFKVVKTHFYKAYFSTNIIDYHIQQKQTAFEWKPVCS